LPASLIVLHAAATSSPISGMPCTQAGGGGIGVVASTFTQPEICCEWSASVLIISNTGAMNTTSIASDIRVTASARPRSHACSLSISGQVAMTIIMAQIVDSRNGRRM
jgi:hypothetical protein